VNHIEIEDDNFALSPERAKTILENVIKFNEPLTTPVTFSAPNGLRIDTLDSEIIWLMKKAGFDSLYLALESGDPTVLEAMNKRLSLARVVDVAREVAVVGLPVLYFLMIGYPGEKRENFMRSMEFCQKLKQIGPARFTTFLARPYPGTQLFEYCMSKGYIDASAEDDIFLGTRYLITTDDFDEAELRWRLSYANVVLNDGKEQDYIL
jgi:radical SAM superfamily enzyme YgiQ (UPF0313 family)